MIAGILSPLHYRTTKLASKVLSRDQIGKTPSDAGAARHCCAITFLQELAAHGAPKRAANAHK
jgi:hypothetical protein